MSANDRGVVPFIYGTAWKEERTQGLVELALKAGFRGIDTANQRKHYDEEAVGRALSEAIASGLVGRDDLFLQTKFTFRRGQDHRLPYDPNESIAVQVEQSFASSLMHLGVGRIDSYLLHGPTSSLGLTADDLSAWRAMEEIVESGGARQLGVSNVTVEQLDRFCQEARIRPAIVQNRCYASRGWDRKAREYCRKHDLIYQGFSLLTANRDVLSSAKLAAIAARHQKTAAQVIFRFAQHIGIVPLTGTSSAEHMRQDLEIFNFQLDQSEIETLTNWG